MSRAKNRLRACGRCKTRMKRTSERVTLFEGHVCRACALQVPLIDTVALGLAGIINKHATKPSSNETAK